jgi:hypothetical protein
MSDKINAQYLSVIERTKANLEMLIDLARPLGPLSASKFRGKVSSRAKWLRNAIAELEGKTTEPAEGSFEAYAARMDAAGR